MSGPVAGVDEAGRGPLAGPVVVAAVILDPARPIAGLADSKQLSAKRREALYTLIVERSLAYATVRVEAVVIDRINILNATFTGMLRALETLPVLPALALIDGNRLPRLLPCPARAIVRGDATEPAISAASILAKVTRDRILIDYEVRWPGYGFAQHKGYPTPAHYAALQRLGPCPEHRRSFAPVRDACLASGEQRSLLSTQNNHATGFVLRPLANTRQPFPNAVASVIDGAVSPVCGDSIPPCEVRDHPG